MTSMSPMASTPMEDRMMYAGDEPAGHGLAVLRRHRSWAWPD